MLQGCVAGNAVMIQPKSISSSVYDCGNFTVQFDGMFADGFMVLYYIIPLAPLTNSSETEGYLELPITMYSRNEPVHTLSVQEVHVQLPEQEEAIYPYKVEITTDKHVPKDSWYYKTMKFTFKINRHELTEFQLIFPNAINGCDVPPTPYIRKEKTHYITPTNS